MQHVLVPPRPKHAPLPVPLWLTSEVPGQITDASLGGHGACLDPVQRPPSVAGLGAVPTAQPMLEAAQDPSHGVVSKARPTQSAVSSSQFRKPVIGARGVGRSRRDLVAVPTSKRRRYSDSTIEKVAAMRSLKQREAMRAVSSKCPIPNRHMIAVAARCRFFERGFCARGDQCSYAHSQEKPVPDEVEAPWATGATPAMVPKPPATPPPLGLLNKMEEDAVSEPAQESQGAPVVGSELVASPQPPNNRSANSDNWTLLVEEELSRADCRRRDLQRQVEAAQSENQRIETSNSELRVFIAKQSAELCDCRKHISSLREVEKWGQDLERELETLRGAEQRYKQELSECQEQVEALRRGNKAQELQEELDRVRCAVVRQEEELGEAREELAVAYGAERKCQELQREVATLQGNMDQRHQFTGDKDTETLQNQLVATQEELAKARMKLDAWKVHDGRVQEEMASTKKKYEEARTELEVQRSRVAEVQEELLTVRSVLDAKRVEVDEVTARGRRSLEQLCSVSGELELLRSRDHKNQNVLAELADLRAQVSKADSNKSDAKNILKQLEEAKTNLSSACTRNAELEEELDSQRKAAVQAKASLLREASEQAASGEQSEMKRLELQAEGEELRRKVEELQKQVLEFQEDACLSSYFGRLHQKTEDMSNASDTEKASGSAPLSPRQNIGRLWTPPPVSIAQMQSSRSLAEMRVALATECDPDPTKMTQILPNVLLSGEAAIHNRERLDEERVTHIISCVRTLDPGDGRQCLILPIEDEPYYPILQHMVQVEQFLRTLERQNRCLIFCRLGVNRSAAVGIALMMRARSMKKPGLTGDDLLHRAFRDVTKRHGRVLTNYGFQRQLLLYASNSCRWSTTWGSETWLLLSDANQERVSRLRANLLESLESAESEQSDENLNWARGTASKFAFDWMRRRQLCLLPSMYKP